MSKGSQVSARGRSKTIIGRGQEYRAGASKLQAMDPNSVIVLHRGGVSSKRARGTRSQPLLLVTRGVVDQLRNSFSLPGLRFLQANR